MWNFRYYNTFTLNYYHQNYFYYYHQRRHAVAQLVEALRYKPEGRGFDSRHNPSGRTMALWSTQLLTEPGIFPGGKGRRCVGLTPLPTLCAGCLEFLGASTSWSPKGLFWP